MGWARLWRPIPVPIVLYRPASQTGLNVSGVRPSALTLPPRGDPAFASSLWRLRADASQVRVQPGAAPPAQQHPARTPAGTLRLGAKPNVRCLPRPCLLRTGCLLTLSAPQEESEETGRTLAEICELRLDLERR